MTIKNEIKLFNTHNKKSNSAFIYNSTLINLFNLLEQFETSSLLNISQSMSVTNISVFYILHGIVIFFFLALGANNIHKNNYLNHIQSLCYQFIKDIFKSNNLLSKHEFFLTFFLYLSAILLFSNVSGLFTYSITITSQILVTFLFSSTMLFNVLLTAIKTHKYLFVNMFLPNGISIGIAPFLILIEILSFTTKVFSLAIRLFANTLAGHILLKILSGMVYTIAFYNFGALVSFLNIFIVLICFVVFVLETFISLLQSYVFIMLSASYFKDVISLH
jgi:ATP synthase subunit 6